MFTQSMIHRCGFEKGWRSTVFRLWISTIVNAVAMKEFGVSELEQQRGRRVESVGEEGEVRRAVSPRQGVQKQRRATF